MSASETLRWQTSSEDSGLRLDKHLSLHLEVPRHQIQQWIRDGRIQLIRGDFSQKVKPSLQLEPEDQITCEILPPEPDPTLEAEAGDLEVLFADEHLVAIDKPAGIAVHPGAGRRQGTLVHRLLHHFPDIASVGGQGRPGIVHRLDLDTTGILIVARTKLAYQRLSEAFSERRLRKTYLAIVHGVPANAEGVIDEPIGRHPNDRKRMTLRHDGRPSITRFEVVDGIPKAAALLRIDLETGRTHQIRVHMKAIGHPLVGDPVYGEARWRGAPRPVQRPLAKFTRPALHARRLELDHPVDGDPLDLVAPFPADLERLWTNIGGTIPEAWDQNR